MAEVVDDNNGKIVKSIGDALLFYFQDSEEGYLKNALNCGLEMVEKRQAINKKLLEKDIPEISYRVSSDFGKVMVGYSSVSVVEDIFGATVNMCSKINPLANNNSMVIGNDFYNVAKMLGNFEFKEIKNNPRIWLDNKYPVFQVQRSWFGNFYMKDSNILVITTDDKVVSRTPSNCMNELIGFSLIFKKV